MGNGEAEGISLPEDLAERAEEALSLGRSVDEFLRGSEVGSPKLLAVADNAALHRANATYSYALLEAEKETPHTQPVSPEGVLRLANVAVRNAVIDETIRNRKLVIPDYAQAYATMQELSDNAVVVLGRRMLPELLNDYARDPRGKAAVARAASAYSANAIAAQLERSVSAIINPVFGSQLKRPGP